jgi:hypothetical protein
MMSIKAEILFCSLLYSQYIENGLTQRVLNKDLMKEDSLRGNRQNLMIMIVKRVIKSVSQLGKH